MTVTFPPGMRLTLSPASGGLSAYYEIIVRRVYAQLPEFNPRRDDVVIDVGANIGVFSVWAGLRASEGALYAIEPHPTSYSFLVRNLEDNGLRTQTFNAGCSDAPGTLDLHFDPRRLIAATFENPGPRQRRTVPISVARLDELVAPTYPTGRRGLLKVDAEGWELRVLAGAVATLAAVDRVVVEFAGAEREPELVAFLDSHGFDRVHVVESLWNDPNFRVVYFLKRS